MDHKPAVLSGNHLKLIAAFTMLLDHMGVLLFPDILLFRILGRISFPLFAYMIAEGCRYTKNKLWYFLLIFGLGAVCQIVYDVMGGALYLNILLTFSMSILLIYALQAAHAALTWQKQILWSALFIAGVAAVYILDGNITIDYRFWGVMTPVFAGFAQIRKFPHWAVVLLLGLGLGLLCTVSVPIQAYAFLALPLLLLYSGRRGRANLKYFFYIFYPVHLAVLQGIAMLMYGGGVCSIS